ncbi:hypothetical protein AO385_1332 [Moraxella catarrhalis]|uniref:SAM-dependent methyltransferase n=2 Tax=Moraxella catarrhalis TaxID=480 RepID=A0A198UJ10_MORCA|nr:hypothetical protein AO384_1059 [Moraxella catarrhalis]OAU97180.1 hypothetical protein AO383_1061 [Moraxella catarrhalis]OAU99724.1 hypothetical protein AO385_1332 [Moraxella catarrhalis]
MTVSAVNDPAYWEARYLANQTGWDAKNISTPLRAYFDQLTDKSAKILIPGAGNAHEGAYLHEQGFEKVFILDFASLPLEQFAKRHTGFDSAHLLHQDFFEATGQYDLIIEQTFFCAIDPSRRPEYAKQMHELLAPKGKLVGLLFGIEMPDGPPFGGSMDEYRALFEPYFDIDVMAPCYNSIKPRAGKEIFIKLIKKSG